MILVDTSIWINHLRAADPRLVELLVGEQVICHPFVIGELACGAMKRRDEILALLRQLPQAPSLPGEDALTFIDVHELMGQGLGWIDVHLLASSYVTGHRLWTGDRRLAQAAQRLKLAP